MRTNTHWTELGEIESRLIDLGVRIEQGTPEQFRINDANGMEEWAGAQVRIVSKLEPGSVSGFDENGFCVHTRHARALSWLLLELRDSVDWVTYAIKDEFYGSHAATALDYIGGNQPEADDPRPLLKAVLRQTFHWLEYFREEGEPPGIREVDCSAPASKTTVRPDELL